MAKTAGAAPVCGYLHHQCWHAAASSSPTHSHDHWQLEYLHEGRARLEGRARALVLEAGSAALIPPRVRHRLVYPVQGAYFVSVKFTAMTTTAGLHPLFFTSSHPCSAMGLALLRLCAGRPLAARGTMRTSIESLASAVLSASALVSLPSSERVDASGVIATMVRERGGGPLSVREVAERCGCAPRTLRERFQAHGRGSVKSCIDRNRAAYAQEQLRYSDASITALAEDLGFADVYAFSRFLRRTTRESPRAFRDKALPEDRHDRAHG